jgi:predicted phage terminase large subunit-like protein
MSEPGPSQNQDLSADDLYALARTDFGTFFEIAFTILNPGKTLDYAPYLDVVIYLMTVCAEGRKSRVIINLPPGFMKSMIVSIIYVAWRLGVDPTTKFVCISYGQDLANKHSVSTRTLMLSPIYRAIFPNTVLVKKEEHWLATSQGGYRYATAVGSDITGFRPNAIIADDPMEPLDGYSERAKEKLRTWLSSSVMTRFEDNSKNLFILVMHRIAPDDICDTLEQQGGYFKLALPFKAEERISLRETKTGPIRILLDLQPGDFLNPNRATEKDWEQLNRELAPHTIAALYQQRPTPSGSGMFSIDRLARYKAPPPKFEAIIHSWDIGATVAGNATVCTKWGLISDAQGRDFLYLLDVITLKLELPDVRAAIKMQDKLDKPDLIVIDHRGVGLGVLQDLRNQGYKHVVTPGNGAATNEGKIERFGRAQSYMYDGLVKFPESAPFLERVLYALVSFPESKDLDLVDSITQVLAFLPRAIKDARRGFRPD